MYTAIGLVTHHASRQPMVLYTSDEHPGHLNVRPLRGWHQQESDGRWIQDQDGWTDLVVAPDRDPSSDDPWIRRFTYVGDAP
jgi:hypothetical protein